MKKVSFFILLFALSFSIHAQQHDAELALKLVNQNLPALGLSKEDVANSIVNSSYYDKFAGVQMVYLQQSYAGLPIFNQLQALAFRDGRLVSAMGKRIPSLEQKINFSMLAPSVNPDDALRTAFSAKKIRIPNTLIATGSRNKVDYGKLGLSHENVTAELMWVPIKDGKFIKLAWQIYVAPTNTSDYWLIRVDAHRNEIIEETNLTVYCNWGHPEQSHTNHCFEQENNTNSPAKNISVNSNTSSPSLVGTANYIVVPFPAESPLHPGGTPALRTNPWTLVGGNATTLGWHNDGTTDYTITRGNNVHAQEDRDNNNTTLGLPATSTTTPDPLNFQFTPSFTVAPTQTTPVPNQQFNITNLFYWNNLTHDITYQYGFDEAAGNFQNSNLGRGGAGNDYVVADGQDGGGTNNANFSTPVDGQKPRMQMYLWNGNPQKDGDADAGVMVHEYGHGISNRLTGGPSTTSCLGNAEQMGEGWSDYYCLMYTQDWANANLNTGFNSPRGIGTYVIGQTPTGLGIRTQRYCTNFAVNNKVFLASLPTIPHDRGEIWCAALWDMTWNIINQVGSINPNIYNPAGGGGNTIALRLVTEGLKLQPCNPGFITGRDAILQADQILYGGQFACAIKEAFRRRGMGANASQGSSSSVTDQTPDFSGGVAISLTQGGTTSVPEGQNIVYNNNVFSGCTAISNFTLTDTLPLNANFVSATNGGTYNAANRVVSWPISLASGTSGNYGFTVNVPLGSYFPSQTFIDDQVTATSIPSTWINTATPAANVWSVVTNTGSSAPNSYFVENLAVSGDQKLEMANNVTLPPNSTPRFIFKHKFNTEDGWDGGVVEISTNNGTTWTDLGPYFTQNAYNSNLGTNPTNVLSGRQGFSGTLNNFIQSTINLGSFAGQTVKIRFRFGSDDNTSGPTSPSGWWVDDIKFLVDPVVNMRTSLFNTTGTRINISDTITIITQTNTCTNVAIVTQPTSQTGCIGSNVTFAAAATGTNISYQWQISANGGISYTDISGETNATLTLTAISNAMNNNLYRVRVFNSCPSTINSQGAVLTVSSTASIVSQPADVNTCVGTSAVFTSTASGTGLTYQWQVSTDGGITYNNITGSTAATLTINPVTAAMNNNLYRVVVLSCGPAGVSSNAALLTTIAQQNITAQPQNTSVCPNANATFTITATGSAVTYQWQRSTDGGNTYVDIVGATASTLSVTGVTLSMDNYRYRAVVKSTCNTAGEASSAAILTVLSPALILQVPADYTGCVSETASFSVQASGSALTYQWQISRGGAAFTNVVNSATYAGATTPTLTVFSLTRNMDGDVFRVVVTGAPCSGLTSDEATLFVRNKPGVTIAAAENSQLSPANPSGIYATVSPAGVYTYQWFKNGNSINVSSPSFPINTDAYGTYQVIVTDVNGCKATSNWITINELYQNNLFIYPNPNHGQFQVRYFNAANTSSIRTLKIYDAKGSIIYKTDYAVTQIYQQMDVDIRKYGKGVYLVELVDKDGKRLATGKVITE